MTDRDKITLPRDVAQLALSYIEWYIENEDGGRFDHVIEAAAAFRTALAAPKQEPSDDRKAMNEALRILLKRESGDLRWQVSDACDILRTAVRKPLAAPSENKTHPGYVIGSHWLETAYSRICAGEAEADVLRDMGWERVDESLRRDAERYRWLRDTAPEGIGDMASVRDSFDTSEIDAAIDAAMGEKR